MDFIVENGSGREDANAFISVEFAVDYWGVRGRMTANLTGYRAAVAAVKGLPDGIPEDFMCPVYLADPTDEQRELQEAQMLEAPTKTYKYDDPEALRVAQAALMAAQAAADDQPTKQQAQAIAAAEADVKAATPIGYEYAGSDFIFDEVEDALKTRRTAFDAAETALETAQEDLAAKIAAQGRDRRHLTTAQQALTEARQTRTDAQGTLDDAQEALADARRALMAAQAAADDPATPEQTQAITEAQNAVDAAQTAANDAQTDLATARTAVNDALTALATVMAPVTIAQCVVEDCTKRRDYARTVRDALAALLNSIHLLEQAIVRATFYLSESFHWKGYRTFGRNNTARDGDHFQALAWPRFGVYDRESAYIPSSGPGSIPRALKWATAEVAFYELENPHGLQPVYQENQRIQQVKAGSASVTYDTSRVSAFGARPRLLAITDLIGEFLATGSGVGGNALVGQAVRM